MAFGVFLVLLFASLLCLYLAGPPLPVPASALATEFSAERALEFNRGFASEVHPAGSPANERSRNYIIETLRSMGVAAEAVTGSYVDGHSAGVATNVLARIPGTANTKAVALEAHYDSVPYGPGASDDGAGVAAIIEASRALRAGPPLMNDVILVISDGEEGGLIGAKVFGRHPWFNDVGVLINFEARGNRGASLMFETSDQNGWLIEQMMKAGVRPRANSMMYDMYKRMPFASDLNVLKPLGVKALNVAFIDNFAHYHTMNDNSDNMDLGSLQHHGSYALGLARHFGNLSLNQVTAPDVVYFNTIDSHMVKYSFETSHALVILTAVVFVAVLLLGFFRRHLGLGGFIAGVIAFLITALCAVAATWILLGVVYGQRELYALYRYDFTQLPDLRVLYRNNEYGWAFFLVTIGLAALLYNGWRRLIRTQNLAAGALAWWLAAMFIAERYLPGGAYIFYWPFLFGSVALGILFLHRKTEELPAGRVALLTVFALPAIALWLPTFQGNMYGVMIIAAPLLMLMPCFLMGLLVPQLEVMARPGKWWLPAVFSTAGLLIWIAATVTNTVSPLRPNLDCLSYGLDLDTGEAYWLSNDDKTDEWTSQFFPAGTPRADISEFVPGDRAMCLKAKAPKAPLSGPHIETVNDTVRDNVREVTLRVTCPDKPSILRLRISSGEVFSATVFGENIHGGKDDWSMRFNLMPQEGLELALKADPSKPLKVNAIEEHLTLPASLEIPPRPKHIVPEPNTVKRHKPIQSQRTFVVRSFEFPAPANPAP